MPTNSTLNAAILPSIAPGDYDSTPHNVTFHPGDIEHPVPIHIVDDAVVEDPEIFTLSMSSAFAGALLGPDSQVLILDDNINDSECAHSRDTTGLYNIVSY